MKQQSTKLDALGNKFSLDTEKFMVLSKITFEAVATLSYRCIAVFKRFYRGALTLALSYFECSTPTSHDNTKPVMSFYGMVLYYIFSQNFLT